MFLDEFLSEAGPTTNSIPILSRLGNAAAIGASEDVVVRLLAENALSQQSLGFLRERDFPAFAVF